MTNNDDGKVLLSQSEVNPYVRLLVWPTVLLAALGMFHKPLSEFISRWKEVEVQRGENGDLKVIMKATEAALALQNAVSESSKAKPETSATDQQITQSVALAASAPSLDQSIVLWVDDNPHNQVYERDALERIGMRVLRAQNTNDAMKVLAENTVSVVITDFKRKDDPEGAYTLLKEMKSRSIKVPVVIYSASATSKFEQEAKKRGAYGETNRPLVLFDMVVRAALSP